MMPEAEENPEQLLEEVRRLRSRLTDLETSLGESVRFANAVFENAPVAMQVFDRHGYSVRMNEAKRLLLGLPNRDAGVGAFNVLTDPLMDALGLATSYRRAFAGEIVTIPNFELNLRVPKDHWESKPVSGIFDEIIFPLRGADGQIDGVVSFLLDITERKQAEADLLESKRFIERVTAASPNALFVYDLVARKSVYHSPALMTITGYTFDEFVAAAPDFRSALLHPDDRDKLAALLHQLESAKDGDFVEETYRQRHKDGEYRWLHTRLLIFSRTANAQPQQVLGVIQDVTSSKQLEAERKRLEEQMQHAQKLESLGVLAGGIAHDFNNLLTGILGHASLALMDLPAEVPARTYIQQIETSAWRAADLTQQMLAYSGRGKFLIQPLNLARLIEEMAKLLQTIITKKAALQFDFPNNLPTIEADATQMRQVVMNLITNASDALGDDNGVIAVRTGVLSVNQAYLTSTWLQEDLPEGRYVFLEVSDTGCGMDTATQQRIFDPFFSTKFTGRGLGLAAVLGIVRGHHGTIKVYSEPGKGTTLKVLFPCAEIVQPPAEPKAADPLVWRGAGLVLVVDDEKSVRGLAKTVLRRAGFEILEAANGIECLELFREHGSRVVVVLLDLTMPQMNGEETFRELRLIQANVRVILMSGYSEAEVATRFAGKGLASVLQKPFHPTDLIQLVRKSIET